MPRTPLTTVVQDDQGNALAAATVEVQYRTRLQAPTTDDATGLWIR